MKLGQKEKDTMDLLRAAGLHVQLRRIAWEGAKTEWCIVVESDDIDEARAILAKIPLKDVKVLIIQAHPFSDESS